MAYRILRFAFGLAVRAFFREISTEGFERIPAQGPVLILPNHPNGLIDPFLILINLKRPVSLTAKATLAKNPLLKLLFKLGKVVPLQRRQDAAEGADMSKNAEALAEARRRLAQGGAVCLFPEGISHSQPGLQPLKTGAARIALDYEAVEGDKGGLVIVPVGIDYSDKQGFRSSAWVRAAEPIRLSDWRRLHPQGGARELTDEIAARLAQSSLSFEKRKESLIIGYAAELMLTRGEEPARVGEDYGAGAALLRNMDALRAAYEAIKAQGRVSELEPLGARIRAYKARLKRLGIEPREVFIDLSPAKALLFALREGSRLMLGLPLALWGMLHFVLPYAACVGIKNALGRERDLRATYAIFGALALFPLYLIALAAFLTWNLPLPWALLWLLSLAPAGMAALAMRDRLLGLISRALCFALFVLRPALRRDLAAEGRAILAEIHSLA